jgi:predicted double-glycine peptidase/ribosomal protein S27E
MKIDLKATVLEETKRALRDEDGFGAGTMSANVAPDVLVAPSTPKSRKDEEEGKSPILGIVRRTFPEAIDGMVGEVECPSCHAVQGFPDDTQDEVACEKCEQKFFVPESVSTQAIASVKESLGDIDLAGKLPPNTLKVDPVQQTTQFCGPAALACLLNFLGLHTTELEVSAAAGVTADKGCTPEGLVDAAKSFGLDAEYKQNGTSADVERFVEQERLPLLFFWWGHGRRGDGLHVSLVVGCDDKSVIIMDPEPGLVLPKLWTSFLETWFTFSTPTPSADGLRLGEYLVIKPKP